MAALLAKGADPTCQSHTCDGNLGCTAAEMASSAGHIGIAAVLAEISLVQALSKAQTGRLPASTVSLSGEISAESDAHLMSESCIQPQMPFLLAGLRCCSAPKRPLLQVDVSIVHDNLICDTAAEVHCSCRASWHGLRSQCQQMGCFQTSCTSTAGTMAGSAHRCNWADSLTHLHLPADWQTAQQRPAASSPTDHSLQRKRCRTDQSLPEGLLLPPPSQLISSARDPMTPNVNIVLRMPSSAPQQGGDSSADTAYQRLTHTLASQSRGGVGLHQNPPASKGVGEGGPAVTVAAAKQAVAVLEQQWQRLHQQSGTSGVRRAKRKQRYGR